MNIIWFAAVSVAAAISGGLIYRTLVTRGRYMLRRSMLRPLQLSDGQWNLVCQDRDFSDFRPADFGDLEEVLLAAQEALAYAKAGAPALVPQLTDIGLWDTSDDNSWDFVMTVDVSPSVRIASLTTKISPYTDLGEGPVAARAVLQELIDQRNLLVCGLAKAIPA